jgi:hypothetical protein
MDLERTTPISTDDDSTMHSTQDRPSVQVHHHHDISSNLHNKTKKIYEPLDDFASDEDNDVDNKIYQEKVWELTNKRKVNSTSTISSIRAGPNARLHVSLCRMVLMLIVRHALKGDITKLEVDFFNGYRDDDRVFYISATDSKGNFQFVDDEVRASWILNWTQVNAVFEFHLNTDLSLTSYNNKMFLICDGNHIFFAWRNYIDRVYTEDYERHVFVDSIILAPEPDDISNLLTAIHDINK